MKFFQMKFIPFVLFILSCGSLQAQSDYKNESMLVGKWKLMYIDTTINTNKKEINCDTSKSCLYLEFTMDKKYMVFYGNKITESGKYIISNDELFESNRIAEGAFPEKLKLEGVKKSKIEKINKKYFVLSGYESGKKVKGQPKSFLFYKKID